PGFDNAQFLIQRIEFFAFVLVIAFEAGDFIANLIGPTLAVFEDAQDRIDRRKVQSPEDRRQERETEREEQPAAIGPGPAQPAQKVLHLGDIPSLGSTSRRGGPAHFVTDPPNFGQGGFPAETALVAGGRLW